MIFSQIKCILILKVEEVSHEEAKTFTTSHKGTQKSLWHFDPACPLQCYFSIVPGSCLLLVTLTVPPTDFLVCFFAKHCPK